MNFLADESVDRDIVVALRAHGYKVTYVAEMEPGITDDAVFDLANKQRAILVTADKDFGEIVFRQHRVIKGVILIRLAGIPQGLKGSLVASVTELHLAELEGAFSVITPKRLRIRKIRRPRRK